MKINSYKQISTKKGDKGASRDYSNNLYMKNDIVFDVLGNIDELSSLLGVTSHYSEYKQIIKSVQRRLQEIMSLVATSNEAVREKLSQITENDLLTLEMIEEELMKTTNIEPVFVLPGSEGSKESAYFDLSRSVTRRCERSLVAFISQSKRTDLDFCLKYLNRLSDLLFIIARNRH